MIAERVKELRRGRGWSAEKLAAEMTAVGVPWSRVVVTKLETKRRPGVSVAELLALAYVLEVAPVHLIVPPLSREEVRPWDRDQMGQAPFFYAVTPNTSGATGTVREWIRGRAAFGEVDPRRYFSEVPADEFGVDPAPDEVVEVDELVRQWRKEEQVDQSSAAPAELRLAEASEPMHSSDQEGKESDANDQES